MSPAEQAAVLAELIERLSGAKLIKLPLPAGVADWDRLHDLIDRAAVKLPMKYRGELLRLERRVRNEIERAIVLSIESGNLVTAANAGPARWAYQSGVLTSALLQFLGRSAPAISEALPSVDTKNAGGSSEPGGDR